MDTTIILLAGIGAAALIFAVLDYRVSLRKRVKLEKTGSSDRR